MATEDQPRPALSPSAIGQFFRLQNCPMYLQWEYDAEAQALIEKRDWEPELLSPVLAGEGDDFERQQLKRLSGAKRQVIGIESESGGDVSYDDTLPDRPLKARTQLAGLLERLASADPDKPSLLIHQAPFEGEVGTYQVQGYADLLDLEPTSEGIKATICEVKSSASQKVHHRYQATIYAMLFEELVSESSIDEQSVTVHAAVLTPENDATAGIESIEQFRTDPYQTKLSLRLQPGGAFDQVILDKSVEKTHNRIARRCSGCEYESLCVTRGVENQGLELIGLQAGTQESLKQLGIETIEDFALLFEQPGEDASHSNYAELEPRDETLVQRIRQEADVSNLQTRAQIAYRFLSEIDADHGRDGPNFFPYELQGAGYNLPSDTHNSDTVDWTSNNGPDYPSGGLVRVYLYVQKDFAQERVTAVSAYVTNTATGRSRQVTKLTDSLPADAADKKDTEDELLYEFFDSFADAVDDVAPDFSGESFDAESSLQAGEGFLHLYLYSQDQREALLEASRRHPSAVWRRPLRTMLGYRAGIDQEMVSILQNDFRRRWALRFPGLGLLQSTAQFKPWEEDWFDWRSERSDGSTAELHEIFAADLFESTVRHDNPDGNLRLDHSRPELAWIPDDRRLGRWVYPVMHRDRDTIPPAYVWAAFDRLDPDAVDDPERVQQYLYRTPNRDERIDKEDIELLATQFSRAIGHVEQGISSKSWFVDKEPINFSELLDLSFENRTIDDACIEYQQLEYAATKTELERYYCQPVAERIDAGSSIAFECTDVDEDRGVLRGRLLTSTLEIFDPVTDDGIIGGPLSVSDRDFMLLTKLDEVGDRAEDVYNGDPTNIAHSPTTIVSSIDEEDGTIEVTLPFEDGWPNGFKKYTNWHKGWGTDQDAYEDGFTVHIEEGDRFVVDPMIDQITQSRAHEALENATNTPVRRWLRELHHGDRQKLDISGFDRRAVTEYLERMAACDGFEPPNKQQRAFIEDVDHGIVTLQGPPGTGKTKYAVAPAILGRLHAAKQTDDELRGVVSAVSHSAVDEALKAVIDLQRHCPPGDDGNDVRLIRVCSSSSQGVDDPQVEHVYYNDATSGEFQELYETYFASDAATQQALFFGPPVSVRSFFNAMCRAVDDIEHDNIAEMMQDGDSTVFDLAVVDEASMIDLPLCLLIGSFLKEEGQLALVGDHRQMQPIQKHEWEDEDREPIRVNVPFLSALDFLRYLRGEDVNIEYLGAEPPDLSEPQEVLPVHRLRETYRLPPESARMHTDLFYDQDGIELESAGGNPRLSSIEGPVSELLDSDHRVTLVIHDEGQSQKSNPVEQALITELIASFTDADIDASAGVVVPFRAQRRDITDMTSESVQVDTVERFQGGERDLMVLSMTASDRGYISQIAEFLLDPNRFNVGASRMKRKLVILASAGIFEESSDDIEKFERHKAWIELYQTMGGLEGEYEEYELSELLSPSTWEKFIDPIDGVSNTRLQVYSGYVP